MKLRWDETRRDYDPDLQARISLPKQARNDPAIKGWDRWYKIDFFSHSSKDIDVLADDVN